MDESDKNNPPKSDELGEIFDVSEENQPIIHGKPPDWFTEADGQILFVLFSGLTLTPSIIAENTEVTRQTVSKRLNTLRAAGYVDKIERGKYKITPDGRFIISNDPEVYPGVHWDSEKEEYVSDQSEE